MNEQPIEVKPVTEPMDEEESYAWAYQALRHLEARPVEQHVWERVLESVASAVFEAYKRGVRAERERCSRVVVAAHGGMAHAIRQCANSGNGIGAGIERGTLVDLRNVSETFGALLKDILDAIRGGK